MYPIEINLLIMFYLTSKFHDNCVNTFGFMEIGNRPRNSKKGGSDWGWGLGGGEGGVELSFVCNIFGHFPVVSICFGHLSVVSETFGCQ